MMKEENANGGTRRFGLYIAFEKILLFIVILTIWMSVLILEKLMPRQSVPILVLILMAIHTLMIYAANVHHRRKIAKGKVMVPDYPEYKPSVSVIIPAHNESFVVAETVRNMMKLDYDNYDIWVFDDRSTDGTADVLAALSKEFPNRFRFVVRPPDATPGKSAVLNDALCYTSGEVLAVFDADGRVQPDFLTSLLPYLGEPGVGAAQARKVIMNAEVNQLTRCQNHEYMLDAHVQTSRDVIRGAVELRGNGLVVKREALDTVGGWTEDTITDDLDLSTKLHVAGWDIRFVPSVTVMEEGITRFKPLLRQRRRWAEGSLKRYLEYAVPLVQSTKVSRRAMFDMFFYFLEFIFPLWLVADLTVQLLNFLVGEMPNHIISSLMALPVLGCFFCSGLLVALKTYRKLPTLPAFLQAIESAIFMLIVWVPVVLWISGKVLVAKDHGPLNWGKTEHLGTQAAVSQSKLARIKQMLARVGGVS